MNQLQRVFNYEGSEVRTVMEDGEPWFVAIDACKILEITNPSQAVTRLDPDERKTIILNEGIAGNPEKTVVNEYGLYSLIFGSRKPEAKTFKRWVTHEVLPSIRRTGSYVTPATNPQDALLLALEATKQNLERLNLVESGLAEVKHELTNHVTITTREQARVQFAVKRRVAELLGEPGTNEYRAHSSRQFASLYGEIKRRFGVPSYKDIRRQDLESAVNYIGAWIPRMVG